MDTDSQEKLDLLRGRTIVSVSYGESFVELVLDDGSTISISSRGSDEGSWLVID